MNANLKPTSEPSQFGEEWTFALAFAAGNRLVSRDGLAHRIWDVAKAAELHHVGGRSTIPTIGLAVSPNGERFVAPLPSDEGQNSSSGLGVWSVGTGNLLDRVEVGKNLTLTAVAYLPNGTSVAVGDINGKVWIVDLATKAVPRSLDGHRGAITCLAVSPDGTRLASGSTDTTVLIWNLVRH